MYRLITGFIALLLILPATAKAEDLTVMLDWFVNPVHAPLIIAQQKGYFDEVGLSVDIVPPADPSDPPKLVAAGRAGITVRTVGKFHGDTVSIGGSSAPLAELSALYRGAFGETFG